MTAYTLVLGLHSLLRWAVLGALAVVVWRAWQGRRQAEWTPADARAGVLAVALLDLQVLLGLVLHLGLSPLTGAAWDDVRGTMRQAPLRFFFVEHGTLMVLAAVALHVGWKVAKRTLDAGPRHGRLLVAAGLALALAFLGTPWPGLPHGRPLLRVPG